MKNACIFLDWDGVINKDNPNYTFRVEDFEILPGVITALGQLKADGYRLIVITNQSGIAQGFYTRHQMDECHQFFQRQSGNLIDHFYFSADHPTVTASLSRKPGTLLFEKAIARYNIDVSRSWMIGDRGRDIIPARRMTIKTIQIGNEIEEKDKADYQVEDLLAAAKIILGNAQG